MSDDMYDDVPPSVRDDEITPSARRLLHAPDGLAQAGPIHHQGADYGVPNTTVTVVEGLQCTHDGVTYGGGEAAVVSATVADYWVRSGWATAESELAIEPPGPAESDDEPAKAAPAKRVSASSGRRSPKR